MSTFHSSADVFDQAHHWTYRVALASFTVDPTGALVRAVIGKNMKHGMAYVSYATIDKAGIMRASVRAIDGSVHAAMPIGTVQAVRDEFRRLADHCRLSDSEREALFEELRKWVTRDERAESGLDIRRHN